MDEEFESAEENAEETKTCSECGMEFTGEGEKCPDCEAGGY